jgi:hypothetical protein
MGPVWLNFTGWQLCAPWAGTLCELGAEGFPLSWLCGYAKPFGHNHFGQCKSSGLKTNYCFYKKPGAAYVTRTRDPIITNDVLYRLS